MISAYASSNKLVLGQLKAEQKSNEITAIPELIRMLDIGGALVTIDAMACQTNIAKAIVEQWWLLFAVSKEQSRKTPTSTGKSVLISASKCGRYCEH